MRQLLNKNHFEIDIPAYRKRPRKNFKHYGRLGNALAYHLGNMEQIKLINYWGYSVGIKLKDGYTWKHIEPWIIKAIKETIFKDKTRIKIKTKKFRTQQPA